jgi:hypothetical protein
MPTSPEPTTTIFSDNTSLAAMDSDPAIASQKLQTNLLAIQNWFKKMENESQQIQVDPCNIHYTKRNVAPGPYKQCATSPRSLLVRRLTWHENIFAKR